MTQRPFRVKVFLLRLLAVIFILQFLVTWRGIVACEKMTIKPGTEVISIKDTCPELGQRVENLFSVALATILSLLSTKETRVWERYKGDTVYFATVCYAVGSSQGASWQRLCIAALHITLKNRKTSLNPGGIQFTQATKSSLIAVLNTMPLMLSAALCCLNDIGARPDHFRSEIFQ